MCVFANSQNEVLNLTQLENTPGVTQLLQVVMTPKKIALVFEYKSSMSLRLFIRQSDLSFVQKLFLMKKLALALQNCHVRKVAHRDVKLSNVVIDNRMDVTLVDFGFSRRAGAAKCLDACDHCGTLLYMAPELVKLQLYDRGWLARPSCRLSNQKPFAPTFGRWEFSSFIFYSKSFPFSTKASTCCAR